MELTTRQIKDLIRYAKDLGAEELAVDAQGFRVKFAPPQPVIHEPKTDDYVSPSQLRFAASG